MLLKGSRDTLSLASRADAAAKLTEDVAMTDSNDLVTVSDDILGGTPVFRGTRVPIQALFDYLDEGQSIGEFLDDFPTVTPDQAHLALSRARDAMLADARPAR